MSDQLSPYPQDTTRLTRLRSFNQVIGAHKQLNRIVPGGNGWGWLYVYCLFFVYNILARLTGFDETMLAVRWEKKRLTFEHWNQYNIVYKKDGSNLRMSLPKKRQSVSFGLKHNSEMLI